MTVAQMQKRNGKSQQLKVIKTGEGMFAVESSEGKIFYSVLMDPEGNPVCTCADYARGRKADINFRCKHIMSVMDSDAEIEEGSVLGKKHPKLDQRFLKNISGRDFVLYSGLLDLAHQKGLIKLTCEILQYPSKENDHECICRATAETKNGEMFIDIGDANKTNTNKLIANHLIRMASTRAKARALRDLTNIGITCLEELGDLSEVIYDTDEARFKTPAKTLRAVPKRAIKPANEEKPADTKVLTGPKSADPAFSEAKTTPVNEKPAKAETPSKGNGTDKEAPKISAAQKNATLNLARRRGINAEELEKMVNTAYGVSVDELTAAQASAFIRQLQLNNP